MNDVPNHIVKTDYATSLDGRPLEEINSKKQSII